MRILVTGGAGCIGSDLCARLLKDGNEVIAFDNLSSGKIEHMKELEKMKGFKFINGSIVAEKQIQSACAGVDMVFHLAANSSVKFKPDDPTDVDLKQNTIGTYNVLEAMRINDVGKIAFTSTSPIYGRAKTIPTPESYGPLETISLYAASKVAGETLISAFSHMFGMRSYIFRIANTVGGKSRKTGGTIISDFISKLESNPKNLEILGDGKQKKSYMTVEDCIDGMIYASSKSAETVNIFNVGPDDNISINEIARIVVREMGLHDVTFSYTGGKGGWTGDVPEFLLDTGKMKKLGWKPKHTSREAVEIATKSLLGGI
ncbi:SDR family NAD(P)-dependent oxidoreductase [Candidatus Woesearchaeota archaeon]|nr:SDR family NAD(P)-dependent oxidoreductase [Candidatus Woesearchaeota archaeon]